MSWNVSVVLDYISYNMIEHGIFVITKIFYFQNLETKYGREQVILRQTS